MAAVPVRRHRIPVGFSLTRRLVREMAGHLANCVDAQCNLAALPAANQPDGQISSDLQNCSQSPK